MATTPLLLVTDVGLQVASVATPQGPWIHITGFQIGSAYGYDSQRTDTGLNGNILFTGKPIAYQNIGDNTINIVLRIPADAGPFEFGEVGIMIGDNADTLFAKAVFESPQTKFSSLGTNLQSTYTFNCLLKLEQSIAVFKIDTENGIPPSIWEVDKWSDIYPPGVSANPDTPAVLCRELDGNSNSSLLHKANDDKWTLGTNYERYGTRTVIAGSLTTVQFSKTQFPNVDPSSASNRQFVIEFADGFYRSVASVTDAGTNWQFNLNPDPLLSLPVVGSAAILYNNNGTSFAALSDVPLMSATVKGIGRVAGGIQVESPGIISVHGLVHSCPNGGGEVLGRYEDLNHYSPGGAGFNGQYWPSGIYTCIAASGWPINYPPVGGMSGILYNVNTFNQAENGIVNQTWYPAGNTGDTAHENAYYRTLLDSGNIIWSPWRKIPILDIGGTVSKSWYNVTAIRPNGSWVVNNTTDEIFVSVAIDSSSGGQINGAAYVDGVQVASYNYRNNRYNNSDSWSYPVPAGSSYMNVLNGDNRVIVVWSELRNAAP